MIKKSAIVQFQLKCIVANVREERKKAIIVNIPEKQSQLNVKFSE